MKIKKYFIFLAGSILFLLISMPTILSVKPVQRALLRAFTDDTVKIEELSLGWFSTIHASGISIRTKELEFSCEEIAISKPFVSWISLKPDLGTISVKSPLVSLKSSSFQENDEKKTARHTQKGMKKSKSDHSSCVLPVKAHLLVQNLEIETNTDEKSIAKLSQGNMDVAIDLLGTTKGVFSASISDTKIEEKAPILVNFELDGSCQGTCQIQGRNISSQFVGSFLDLVMPQGKLLSKECFGKSLSLTSNLTFGPNLFNFEGNLSSENVQMNLQGSLQDGSLKLQPGTLFKGTLSPSMYTSFLSPLIGKNSSIKDPIALSLDNKKPLLFDLEKKEVKSPIQVTLTHSPEIVLILENHLSNTSEKLTLSLQASLTGDEKECLFSCLVLSENSFSKKERAALQVILSKEKLQNDTEVMSYRLAFDGSWPSLLEKIIEKPLSPLLGNECSGSCLFFSENESIHGQVHLLSKNLHEDLSFSLKDHLLTIPKGDISFTLPIQNLSTILGSPVQGNPNDCFTLTSNLQDVSFPLKDTFNNLEELEGSFSLDCVIPAFSYENSLSFLPSRLALSLKKPKNETLIPLDIQGTLQPKTVQNISFSSLVTLQAKTIIDTKKSLINVLVADVDSEELKLHLDPMHASWNKNLSISLLSPLTCSLTLSETIGKIFNISKTSPKDELKLTLSLNPFEKNQDKPISFSLKTTPFLLSSFQEPCAFECSGNIDLQEKELVFSPILTISSLPSLKSTIKASFQDSWKTIQKATCSLELNKTPISLIDALAQNPFSDIFGPQVTLKLTSTYKPNFLDVDSSISGDFWKSTLNFKIEDTKFSLKDPYKLFFTMPKDRFEKIKRSFHLSTPLSLLKDLTYQASSTSLSFMLKDHDFWSTLHGLSGNIQISSSELACSSKGKELPHLHGLEGSLDIQGNKGTCSLTLSSPHEKKGTFISLQSNIEDMWTQNGLSFQDATIKTSLSLKKLPTTFLESSLQVKDNLLSETIGNEIDVALSFSQKQNKTGSFSLDLKTEFLQAHGSGIVENSVLKLSEPFVMRFLITEQAGDLLLNDACPFIIKSIHSKDPLVLTIDPRDVAIPIKPFSIKSMNIPKITLDTGKLQAKNGKIFTTILSLLRMKKLKSKETNLWPTPIFLSMTQGILSIQRVDFLAADDLHMAIWGFIDFDQELMNMVVFVPSETLLKLKMISRGGLQIPITGPFSDPSIDTTRTTAKIAGMGMVTGGAALGPASVIVGGLLQEAAAVGDKSQPVPPPTTVPFPWE